MRDLFRRMAVPSVGVTRWAVIILTPMAALVGASFTARATVTPPMFPAQSVLSSAKLNQAFADLAAAVNKPVIDRANKRYSIGATTCGATVSLNGNLGGYKTAKQQCETACNSTSAHMCSSEEIVRSLQMGVLGSVLKSGQAHWYSSGEYGQNGTTTDYTMNDCNMWTYATSGQGPAVTWTSTSATGSLSPASCTTSQPVACCD